LKGSRDHNAIQVCTGIVIETDATLFVVDDDSPMNKSLKNLIQSFVG